MHHCTKSQKPMLYARMSETRKRQAKAWALVSTGGIDIDEFIKSMNEKISKGQNLSGKQIHFCTHHKRFNCKHTCRARANEIGVKVLEESGSHDYDTMLEAHKSGLESCVKERAK